MDQTMIDLGPETDVKVGDKVVLIGKSGDEEITVDELADKLGTITYEVTCQINPRVKRYYGKNPR
jgi:alanine racemase